jgi:hypothetical protein
MFLKSYEDWRKHSGKVGSVSEAKWTTNDYEHFDWKETYMIEELPANDRWNTFATQHKLDSEELYKEWGVQKGNTKHYMCIRPELPACMETMLTQYQNRSHNYNFLKLTPGNQLVWHFDTFATFVKFNDIKQEQIKDVCRAAVFLEDWDRGQMLQVGDDVYTHWKKGDTYTWKSDVWHGMCNFGPSDAVIAQITFLDEANEYSKEY